ncbi:protein-L-isoaspartate O-methyltransferase, partial [uncultured Sphingomonas sp.]|uniref:protein-L-isoaspartate O-methyltransferase family protein n=1 Tax=uncultured Sphingomonas sp. TaxID=158754 RepID=UPI0035CC6899
YRDTSIPLGEGRHANLPMATGRLLNAADLLAGDRVLLIGAAGGYTAAILSEIVASVVAVESLPALCVLAREALAGRLNVTLVEGPLAEGAADGQPYDVLIVDGAIAHVPDAIIHQVRPGGRVATGLSERGMTRLTAGRRSAGGFGLVPFADCDCVVLPGFDRPAGFRF